MSTKLNHQSLDDSFPISLSVNKATVITFQLIITFLVPKTILVRTLISDGYQHESGSGDITEAFISWHILLFFFLLETVCFFWSPVKLSEGKHLVLLKGLIMIYSYLKAPIL